MCYQPQLVANPNCRSLNPRVRAASARSLQRVSLKMSGDPVKTGAWAATLRGGRFENTAPTFCCKLCFSFVVTTLPLHACTDPCGAQELNAWLLSNSEPGKVVVKARGVRSKPPVYVSMGVQKADPNSPWASGSESLASDLTLRTLTIYKKEVLKCSFTLAAKEVTLTTPPPPPKQRPQLYRSGLPASISNPSPIPAKVCDSAVCLCEPQPSDSPCVTVSQTRCQAEP